MNLLDIMLPGFKGVPVDDNFNYYSCYTTLSTTPYYGVSFPRLKTRAFFFCEDSIHIYHKRINTGMAPTCDWMIKIVKVNKLYFNSLLVSIVNRLYQSGTMKCPCE